MQTFESANPLIAFLLFFFFLDLRLALGLVARLSFMLKYQLYNMTEICAYSQYGGGNSFCVCVWVLAVEELASEY